MVYTGTMKVYEGFSARRFDCDVRDAHSQGFIDVAPSFNSVNRYIADPDLTPVITDLIEQSAASLSAVESQFAADSSCFSTCRFDRWYDAKWGKEKSQRHWLKAHIVAAATAPPAASGSTKTNREALAALYNATGGENWKYSYNWLSDARLSEWSGIATIGFSRVESLSLGENQLRGEIPAELGSLSNLTELGLSYNDLSGEIPAELGSLSNLKSLSLSYNDLSGEIPAELGSLSNLEALYLSGNDLSGEIPEELGSLSNLEALGLDDNDLSGEIPPELGILSNLLGLVLGGNDLSGCVPSSLEDQSTSSDLGGLPFC